MANTALHIPSLLNIGKFIDYRQRIWGDSFNWSWNRKPNEVKYLVIHHTVTSHDATPDDIALLHKARGWAGIGYHFVITKDGTVYYVGDVGTARANVLNMNEKVIGISLIGDFTKHLPSDAQILSAHLLCKFFLDNKAVWTGLVDWDTSVKGHKELQATQCPGNDWKDTSSCLFNRIKNNIPYTPVENPSTPETPVTPTTPSEPSVDYKQKYEEAQKQVSELNKSLETCKESGRHSVNVANYIATKYVELYNRSWQDVISWLLSRKTITIEDITIEAMDYANNK